MDLRNYFLVFCGTNTMYLAKEICDVAHKVITVSNFIKSRVETIGSKDEVLPHLSEIYSTCTILEEAE